MTRKEEREQFAAESVKGADKLYGYKYSIKDVESAIIDGALWADETMIDKVCEWIEENHALYEGVPGSFVASFFRKEMEE